MFSVGFDTSALDASFKSHAHRGIGRYVSELKRYFDAAQSDGKVEVGYFDHQSFFGGSIVKPLLKALPAGVNTVRQQIFFPVQLLTGVTSKYNFVHFPAHMDAPAWSIKRYAVTVLDLIPLVLSELYRPERGNFRFHFARWLEIQAIRNASLILAISENTAKDVVRLLGVPRDRIEVTPLGVDERFFSTPSGVVEAEIRSKYGIPQGRPIVTYVGGIDQRKNYRFLVNVVAGVIKSCTEKGVTAPVLVMAGKIDSDRQYPKLLKAIEESGVADSVFLTGYMPDDDLRSFFSVSTIFFFPSLYEGFGLPPLEAMAAGVPVVSSDTSCMPEILGDAALYIDPNDEENAVKQIESLIKDGQRLSEMREVGKRRAQQFTWQRTGELTMKSYHRLLEIEGR